MLVRTESLISQISPRNRIFQQNHFSLFIRGPQVGLIHGENVPKISWHFHFKGSNSVRHAFSYTMWRGQLTVHYFRLKLVRCATLGNLGVCRIFSWRGGGIEVVLLSQNNPFLEKQNNRHFYWSLRFLYFPVVEREVKDLFSLQTKSITVQYRG